MQGILQLHCNSIETYTTLIQAIKKKRSVNTQNLLGTSEVPPTHKFNHFIYFKKKI